MPIEIETKYNLQYCCDLCATNKYVDKFFINGRKVVACNSCGLVSYHPIPSPGELTRIYESEEYFENKSFDYCEEGTVHYRHFIKAVTLAQVQCSRGEKLLEIGPGKGDFLKLCRKEGIDVEGLEFSKLAADSLRKDSGCKIYQGTLENSQFAPSSYAMVASFDLLEHCVSPKILLESINKILKPSGLLVLSTLNVANFLYGVGDLCYKFGIKNFIKKLHPPYHLYYFNRSVLEKYLGACGFDIVSMVQEHYDYRKAAATPLERMALMGIYIVHDLTGQKTNFYITAKKRS